MQSAVVDWDSIKNRLAAASLAAGGVESSPEDTRRILEARARAAARPVAAPDEVERLEVLAFSLAGETYGVETRYVREARLLEELTELPCTPPFVAGVTSLHGQVVAIVDLRCFFGLPAPGITELNRVVVLGNRDETAFGLLADSVEGVRSIAVPEQEGLPTHAGIRETYLLGVTPGMLAVLDGGRLVGDAGLKVNEQVIA